MSNPRKQRDKTLGSGVYFAWDDDVGIFPRIVIIVIDLAVLIGVYIILTQAFLLLWPSRGQAFFICCLVIAWVYLAICKASPLRTFGYWIMGARILNLRGTRPSVFRMMVRTMMWGLGPFCLLFDLFWSGVDDDRQTLRGRIAGTVVVTQDAEPIGTAEIHLTHYTACGYTFVDPRVMRPKES